jgi:hypothetical protein
LPPPFVPPPQAAPGEVPVIPEATTLLLLAAGLGLLLLATGRWRRR